MNTGNLFFSQSFLKNIVLKQYCTCQSSSRNVFHVKDERLAMGIFSSFLNVRQHVKSFYWIIFFRNLVCWFFL